MPNSDADLGFTMMFGRKVAQTLRNGEALCRAFQQGNCRAKTACPGGAHKCGVLTSKNRVCGLSNHGAKTHKANPAVLTAGKGGRR